MKDHGVGARTLRRRDSERESQTGINVGSDFCIHTSSLTSRCATRVRFRWTSPPTAKVPPLTSERRGDMSVEVLKLGDRQNAKIHRIIPTSTLTFSGNNNSDLQQ